MIINAETNEGAIVTPKGWQILQKMGYSKKDLDIHGDLIFENTNKYKAAWIAIHLA